MDHIDGHDKWKERGFCDMDDDDICDCGHSISKNHSLVIDHSGGKTLFKEHCIVCDSECKSLDE